MAVNELKRFSFVVGFIEPDPQTDDVCGRWTDDGGQNTTTLLDGWRLWSSIRLQHPEYPATPEWNAIYVRSA